MPDTRAAREGAFISYARADGEAPAQALRERLAADASDMPVWMDRLELEGGIGWWNQIEQQLDRVEFLLLVMSPAAMRSENTRREWRAARQRGVCVYPVLASAGQSLDADALPPWMRKAHFYDPEREWLKLVAHLRRGCRANRVPFMAPPLPAGYVPRPRESEALVSLLLADGGATRPTALRGPGGFGKSSLAAALCHDDRLIEAFDDGILWTTLGPAPNLLAEMQKLYGALTGERPGFVDVDDASRELAQRLEGKNCLIVIDDAWSPAHLRPFLFAGGPKQLVTTRVFDVAMGCERIDLDRMEDDESLQLLLTRAELQPADAGAYRRLARRLGDWPLTLKLAGSAIRQRVARGDTPERALDFVERALDKRGMTAFDRDGAIDRGATVESTLAPSLGLLGAEAERRYTELAVFADAEAVPLAAAEALWQLDDLDTEDLARRLDDLALAELDLRRGTLRVHDVLRSLLRGKLADAAAVHGRLVDAWGLFPPAGDAFAWRHLASHLVGAGRAAALRGLLFDPAWLAAKLAATDVYALIADFEALAGDAAARLLRDALRLSVAALAREPRQLAPQLLARLMARSEPELVALLTALRAAHAGPLLLPLHATLDAPGGMLAMTLTGHDRGVTAIALSADGAVLLSASDDGTVRSWTEDGLVLRTLDLPSQGALSLAVSADGRTAVCGGTDGRLHVVDVASGAVRARLSQEPRRGVNALALSADGSLAVCASRSADLRVWDLAGQRMLRLLEGGHDDTVSAIALSADGRLAVSASDDGTLRCWDVASGQPLQRLAGHAGPVTSVALSADGRIALSGSVDRSLRVWDVASGACLQRLLGHEGTVSAVDLSADGQRALSGASNRLLNLWDVAAGRLLGQVAAHGDAIHAVRFHPGGLAATASADRTIKLWHLAELDSLQPSDSHDGAVQALAFTADGQRCASGGAEGTIQLWDVASGRRSASFGTAGGAPIQTLAFTPDGLCIMAGEVGGGYRLWFIDTGDSAWLPIRHLAPVQHAAFSHDGHRLLTACSDRFVYLWDVASGSLIARHGTRRLFDHLITPSPRRAQQDDSAEWQDTYLPGEPVYAVAGVRIGDDGRAIAISATPAPLDSDRRAPPAEPAEACIVVLDTLTGAITTLASGQAAPIAGFEIDAGGHRVVWQRHDQQLAVWRDAPAGEQACFTGHRTRVSAIAIAPGRGVVFSCALDRSLRAWRLDSGAELATLVGDSPLRALRLSPDEQTVAVGDAQGKVHLVRLEVAGGA
jgi:WD40 repeat protein